MNNRFFILTLLSVNFLRALFYPLWAEILPLLWPRLCLRRDFERLNLLDPLSRSFRLDGKIGHILFHISSEGELEQVRPLISHYLENHYNLELVYTSESVEKKCQQLAIESQGRIRLFRLPLVTFFFFSWGGAQSLQSWSSAKRIVLCRYDFFPELLLFGAAPAHQFVLVNASLKGKEKLQPLLHWYYQHIYSLFDTIVAATARDRELLTGLVQNKNTVFEQFDFRIMQIDRRISNQLQTLKQKKMLPLIEYFEQRFDKSKRVIMGSAWPQEMAILENKEFFSKIRLGDILLFIAPHQLSAASLQAFDKEISRIAHSLHIEMPIYIIAKEFTSNDIDQLIRDYMEKPGIIISQLPGVLCELYTHFGHAYVGGGHGRSIHSVLEPFVAGAHLFCGPKTHRSTEFDFVREFDPQAIEVVDSYSSFYPTYKRTHDFIYDHLKHQHFINKSVGRFLAIIQQLHLG